VNRFLIEEVVAPGDRVAHRAQAGRLVARAAGEQWQPAVEPLQERRRRQRVGTGGGELDGEGQSIHPPDDRGHRRRVVGCRDEVGSDRPRSCDEELYRLGLADSLRR
jgi:hypothetical protein